MKNLFRILFLIPCLLIAQIDLSNLGPTQQPILKMHNRILAKVGERTISTLDVKKQMDMVFHKNYPHLIDNEMARYQFYHSSWKRTLEDMVQTELMIADSKTKDLKLSDGDVHEEVMKRYGPNVVETLEKIGLTESEAKKMVKDELIVQRMMWFFVYMKAQKSVLPVDVRTEYRKYLEENPPKDLWRYNVITIRGSNNQDLAENLYNSITNEHKELKDLSTLFENQKEISLSNEFEVDTKNLSDKHKEVLKNLTIGSYSEPVVQKSRRTGETLKRIFYLKDHQKDEAPPFDKMYEDLRKNMFYQEADVIAKEYIAKLKKFYEYESLVDQLPENFQPFAVESIALQ